MSGEAEISLSGTSTAASVFRGAAEAPRGAGSRAAEEEEVVSRPPVVRDVERQAAITGPAAQAEARARDIRRAHLMATLRERTAGTPGLSPLWAELEALDQVNTRAFLISCADRKSVV